MHFTTDRRGRWGREGLNAFLSSIVRHIVTAVGNQFSFTFSAIERADGYWNEVEAFYWGSSNSFILPLGIRLKCQGVFKIAMFNVRSNPDLRAWNWLGNVFFNLRCHWTFIEINVFASIFRNISKRHFSQYIVDLQQLFLNSLLKSVYSNKWGNGSCAQTVDLCDGISLQSDNLFVPMISTIHKMFNMGRVMQGTP